MDRENKEKMFENMMSMCCTGISEKGKQEVKDLMESCCKNMADMMPKLKGMFKEMPEGFKSCCRTKDFSEFMKHCCTTPEKGTSERKHV